MISPTEKPTHLDAYKQAIQTHEGGAYLRTNGLYSSQIVQWRKQRDAGIFDGKQPGETIGKPTKEEAQIARLKRQLAKRQRHLETTQTALDVTGKHTRSWYGFPGRGCSRCQAQQPLKYAYTL